MRQLRNKKIYFFLKLLYFEWSPPRHLYVLLLTIFLSHRYQPLPLQASHCVLFWSVTLLAGLPLHSRMSPGVTACSSGCKTNMPRHVGVHLHHSCHVACSAAWKTNMPRHVGDHLNHSCHVACSTAWKTNMPGHCGKPSESVMECHLQMRLDNKHAKTYQATTWFKTELLMYTVLLSKHTQLSHYHKPRSSWFWHDELSWNISFAYATSAHAGCIDKIDPDRTGEDTQPTSSAPVITSHHIGAGSPVITTVSIFSTTSIASAKSGHTCKCSTGSNCCNSIAIAWNIRASHQKVSV